MTSLPFILLTVAQLSLGWAVVWLITWWGWRLLVVLFYGILFSLENWEYGPDSWPSEANCLGAQSLPVMANNKSPRVGIGAGINASLLFPALLKEAVVMSLLKKLSVNSSMWNNYRSVSNVLFCGKSAQVCGHNSRISWKKQIFWTHFNLGLGPDLDRNCLGCLVGWPQGSEGQGEYGSVDSPGLLCSIHYHWP